MEENYRKIIELLTHRKEKIAFMESCTGGALSNQFTNIEGSSRVFEFGAITYSNDYKIKMGVDPSVIDMYSVYSIQTARSMAKAICNFANTHYGIGITGKLGTIDPNNLIGSDHVIYIAIYDKKSNIFVEQTLTANSSKRVDNKKAILNILSIKLIELLKKK